MNPAKADLKGKKILFIASFYPPVASTNVPGAMRTIKFLRNIENGECHVLTTPPVMPEADSALKHLTLPVNNEVIHRVADFDIFKVLLSIRARLKALIKNKSAQASAEGAGAPTQQVFKSSANSAGSQSKAQQLKDFVYNLCYFPDQAGPWIFPAYRAGKKLVQERGIDAIFATGSPWSGLLVGYIISKATGKPFIADFRDPWMNNPFHQSKGAFLDNWSQKLERKVVDSAAAISLNTEPLKQDFIQRYPHVSQDKFFVMPNGFDLSDFDSIDSLDKTAANTNTHIITLCHAGFLYGVRDPAPLLDAIALANKTLQAHNTQVRFQQIGDVQLAYQIAERYQAMIADGALLLEPSRPYQEALNALAAADWVVNIQPGTKTQVPSKLYDYLAINRPILNITPKDGALGQLVNQYQLGEQFDFDETEELAKHLVDIATQKREQSGEFSGYASRSEFDCRKISAELTDKINQLV